MKSPISRHGRAAWCSIFLTLERAGSVSARCPFHAAGFSPERQPRVFAKSNILSMRPRSLLPVSGLVSQIGSTAANTWAVAMSPTGRSPKTGLAYVSIVAPHSAACFGFRHEGVWPSMKRCAASRNVTRLTTASCAAAFAAATAACLAARGSTPLLTCRNRADALCRASARRTELRPSPARPSPASLSLEPLTL